MNYHAQYDFDSDVQACYAAVLYAFTSSVGLAYFLSWKIFRNFRRIFLAKIYVKIAVTLRKNSGGIFRTLSRRKKTSEN